MRHKKPEKYIFDDFLRFIIRNNFILNYVVNIFARCPNVVSPGHTVILVVTTLKGKLKKILRWFLKKSYFFLKSIFP